MGKLKALGVGVTVAGIALVICRYALLPMTKDLRWVQHLGLGLIIGGSVVARAIADDMSKVLAGVAAVVGAAVAVAAVVVFLKPVATADLRLVTKTFPGITIQLPEGTPSIDTTSAANGTWKLDRVGKRRGLVQLGWQLGHTEITPEQYATLFGIAKPGNTVNVTSEATEVNGHAARILTFPIKKHEVFMSTWYCKEHDRDYAVSTMVFESRKAARAFHERITRSAKCHMGDKPQIALSRPLLSLGPSYGYQQDSDPVSFLSLDGGELAFQPIPGNTVSMLGKRPELVVEFFKVVPTMSQVRLDGMPRAAKAPDGTERAVIRIRYIENGEDGFASVTSMDCSPQQSFLVLHSYDRPDKQAAAEAAMLTARCAKDAPVQKHPSVATVFTKACDGGDARGCYYLGLLSASADPPQMMDAARYYTSGCKLDHALSCNNLGVQVAASGAEDAAARAHQLYEKACKLGEKLGCNNAGR